jgi:hypothetical protein
LPERVHLIPLPPYNAELKPVEDIVDFIKDQIGNSLWSTLEALKIAIGEEIQPIYLTPEPVRSLVSPFWLIDQVNVSVLEFSAITCRKWYRTIKQTARRRRPIQFYI